MPNINSLRKHLFDALERLSSERDADVLEFEINRSASLVQVADAIIRTVEVENRFIAITKLTGSGFVSDAPDDSEMFDVDNKSNWLAEGGNPHNNSKPISNPVKLSKIG